MTQEHVLAALAAVTSLEAKCDAIGVFCHLLARVKEGHTEKPISPLELRRIRAALTTLQAALNAAKLEAPSHWELLS